MVCTKLLNPQARAVQLREWCAGLEFVDGDKSSFWIPLLEGLHKPLTKRSFKRRTCCFGVPDQLQVFLLTLLLWCGWCGFCYVTLFMYWRYVSSAQSDFDNFSWQGAKCECCILQHQDRRGRPISCDREMLGECVGRWFDSVHVFEEYVRKDMKDLFMSQVAYHPFSLRELFALGFPVLWYHMDCAAALAHGSEPVHAALMLARGIIWGLLIGPSLFAILIAVSRWFHYAAHGKNPRLWRLVGFLVFMFLSIAPLYVVGLLYRYMQPVAATITWAIVALLVAGCVRVALYSISDQNCRFSL